MARSFDFPAGGGCVGALMRAHDWSTSPLGPPDRWPQPLRTVVTLLLQSRFPMFVAWGPELGFLYNDPYAEILGAKHPAALGRRFRDIWSEIWSDINPLIEAAMAGHATYREDLPLVMNRKGYDEQTWFTFSYSPVHDDRGRVAGMFCAVWETTETVLAERALRESNETLERRVDEALAERKLLADIVEGMSAIVQVVDLDYRWLAINQVAVSAFEQIFGVRPRVGDNMIDLMAAHPDAQVQARALWSRALRGEAFTATEEFGDAKADRRAYEMRFSVLRDHDGHRIGAYQFAYDVTERVRAQERLRDAEAALRQAQKIEALGQLTGGIAHDFNNLLAVFASGLQLVEFSGGQMPPRRVFEAMRRAVARGTGLTRSLLAFSRRHPLNAESIDVMTHLTGMRDMLDGSLGGHINVSMNVAPDVWPVEADAGELELAILNLCLNARDAMADGGTITVAAQNLAADTTDDAHRDFVKISVTDTGHGMPPEVRARVFEPFFTTKDMSKGSGLGLPQVYGFVQQSAGRIAVDSSVGVGTVVTLLLPRSRRDSVPVDESAGVSAERVGGSRRGHVLLVEDDLEVSALTRELLKSLGFQVTHVTGAEAALEALAVGHHFDQVLSDIMMPGGVSGLQLAREIRRRYPALPVILTTGYVEAAADLNEGEFELLSKPFSLDSLAEALGITLNESLRHDASPLETSSSGEPPVSGQKPH